MKPSDAALIRLNEARKLAAEHGGVCVTNTPISPRKNFEFTCPKGHKNFFKRHDSVKQGKYCPKCAMLAKGLQQVKHTKASLDSYAASKNGQCLSEAYLGYNTLHLFQCHKGHRWEAKPRMLLGMGSWCPVCAGNKKYTVEELNSLVANRGGRCLDLAYDPVTERSSAMWECHFGHRWLARVDMIIRRGDWCPTCAGSYGERLCRQIIEKLFDAPFPKFRPNWLMGEMGRPLEIDIFNASLFGVEYQGPHHYGKTSFTHDSHENISARDAIKCARAKEMGFVLVQMPEFDDILDEDGCIKSVKDVLINHGIAIPDRQISIDYRSVYTNSEGVEFFKELNTYVAERGGMLVVDHFAGLSRDYQVVCKHGHQFTLNRYDIPHGKWCRECYNKRLYQKYSLIVAKRGGRMLSDRYVSSNTPMEIESSSGKKLALTPHQLSHGYFI